MNTTRIEERTISAGVGPIVVVTFVATGTIALWLNATWLGIDPFTVTGENFWKQHGAMGIVKLYVPGIVVAIAATRLSATIARHLLPRQVLRKAITEYSDEEADDFNGYGWQVPCAACGRHQRISGEPSEDPARYLCGFCGSSVSVRGNGQRVEVTSISRVHGIPQHLSKDKHA